MNAAVPEGIDQLAGIIQNPERLEFEDSEEYYKVPALSGSVIRQFAKTMNPRELVKDGPTETQHMRLGSALDCYLLEPDMFEKRYGVLKEGTATPTTAPQEKFTRLIIEDDMGYEDAYRQSYAAFSKKKAETLHESLKPFIEASKEGKSILSLDDFNAVQSMYQTATAHSRWPLIEADEHQVAFISTLNDPMNPMSIKLKGMLDALGDDYVTDVKTTAQFDDFRWNFFKRGYDLQMAIYMTLAQRNKGGIFLIESIPPYRCKAIDVTEHAITAMAKAFELINRILWHITTGRLEHTMEYYINDGWETL